MKQNKTRGNTAAVIMLLILFPLAAMIVSLFVGRYPLPPSVVLSALFRPSAVSNAALVTVRQLRLPRALAAAFVGASLSASGAAFQSVFRNPLVNSGILGVSSGAGFGACLAIVFFGGGVFTYGLSFLFAVAAVVLSYLAGRVSGSQTVIMLILGGTIVSAFFSALVSLLKYVADPYSQLPAITFWLMGSFASVGIPHLTALIPMSVGMGIILLCRRSIDVLSMGEREASSLGVDVRLYALLVIGGATLCTASAVCISGTIGWVGLVIPHIGRMIVGSKSAKLIPASISLGAGFLVVMDLISRSLTGSEIPIGILCALIGTPFFVYLLKSRKGGGWA